ncbi:MAG: histidine ammonia-lyase [Calditrichaeota bacterium]|nr:histidine ammonia-lyase [Calditrichota bacterium]
MLEIDGHSLDIDSLLCAATGDVKVGLSKDACDRITRSADLVRRMVERGDVIYGVTTGIGEFAKVRVSPVQGAELQRRIILSHAAGIGDPLPKPVVRAAMILRLNTLARGNSGVRLATAEQLVEMLNRGVTPVVYEKGSLGVSGDLAPLAQLAAVCIGEGEAWWGEERLPGSEALDRAGLKPVELTFKEGLGLINGSQVSTGGAALLLVESRRLLKNAVIAAAMTIDALKGVVSAYDARVHRARPHNGQNVVARHLRLLMEGSAIIADGSTRVQDGYSLRCTPQVLGPIIDCWRYVRQEVETEMNASTDNPLFFTDDEVCLAGGNFHSENIALAMDFLGIALAEVSNLAERHINRMMNPVLSGLPDFLVEGKGLNSGLMVAQYTAAALASENKVLAHPASVDSIPVSADQEDHVAMTPIAIRKCGEIIRNGQSVIAIEMLAAAQALDFRLPLSSGRGTAVAHKTIRQIVSHWDEDRLLYPEIEAVRRLVETGDVVADIETICGELWFDIPEGLAD